MAAANEEQSTGASPSLSWIVSERPQYKSKPVSVLPVWYLPGHSSAVIDGFSLGSRIRKRVGEKECARVCVSEIEREKRERERDNRMKYDGQAMSTMTVKHRPVRNF